MEEELLALIRLVGDEAVLSLDGVDASTDEVLTGRDGHRPFPVRQHASSDLTIERTSKRVARERMAKNEDDFAES